MKTQENKHTMERLAGQFDKYKKGFFFPSDDIDPKMKKGGWCLSWQEAIWGLFVNNGCFLGVNGYQDLQQLRQYGSGKQNNRIYMDMMIGDETMNPERRGFMSTNWKPFSPMSKFKRIIRGRFETMDYMAVANAIDPTSQAKKEDKKWEIWYDSNHGDDDRKVMADVTGKAADPNKIRYVARSLEELEMFNELGGIKLQTEAEIETALDATDYISDIRTIKEKVLDDLVDFGKAAFRDFYDPTSGLVKKEYVDWENLIIDYSRETDFKDIRFWSYIKFETINNVRVRSGLTEEEIILIARTNCGYWGNMDSVSLNNYSRVGYRNEKGIRVYDEFRIPVLVSEWISTDKEYKLSKEKRDGSNSYYPQEHGKVYNTETKKTKITEVNNVYNSTWIIGSKCVYDDGISLNTARPNPKEPKLSIHAVALPGQSITESIIPNLDQLCLAWFKWQSSMAQASPAGTEWDMTQLEGIDLGAGTMKPLDLIQLKRQTGDTFRRTINLQGKYNNSGKAANKNEGGIGELLNEIVTTMDMQFKYIADLTGIDLISGASMKPGEVTATEVNKAGAATTDALQPLFTSWVQMQEHASQTVACKIQRAIKHNPVARETYEGILGRSGAKILSIGADTTAAEFGIKIELKSNKEMTQFAMETVMESIKIGANGGPGISGADGYYFVDMIQRGRVKQAMALFNFKVNKARAAASKMQEDNMKANGENMLRTQQAKDEGEEKKIELKAQAAMKQEAIKALMQMNVDNNTHLNELKQMYIQQILEPQQQESAPAEGQAAA